MSRRTRAAFVVVSVSAFGCALDTGQVETFGSGYSVGDDSNHDDDEDGTGDGATDDGVESGPVDGGDDDGDAPGEGDCCVGHETPGCGDQAMQTCVCAQDPFCCDSKWDDLCASLVEKNGCGLCAGPMDDGGGIDDGGGSEGGPVDDGGGIDDGGGTDDGGGIDDGGGTDDGVVEEGGGTDDGGGGVGDCCSAHAGTGCADADVEACVCAQDDYCCTTEWDGICVGEVDSLGCGMCEAGGTDGGGGTTDDDGVGTDDGAIDPGDCCIAHAGVGCTEPSIEACVCAADDYCCTTEWDGICVDEVDEFGCGTCV